MERREPFIFSADIGKKAINIINVKTALRSLRQILILGNSGVQFAQDTAIVD